MRAEHTASTSASERVSVRREPAQKRERIDSVDTIRGISLCGILLMNILSFGLPGIAGQNPTLLGKAVEWNTWTWYVVSVLFEGKMRAMFSMLFGAGLVLMTSRAELRGGSAEIADIWLRRSLWLLAFGLIHNYFIWEGDILAPYALCGLLLYPFRKLPAKALIAAAVVTLAFNAPNAVINHIDTQVMHADYQLARSIEKTPFEKKLLTDDLRKAREKWEEKLKEVTPPREQLEKRIHEQRQSYWRIFQRRAADQNNALPLWLYHGGIFDAAGMMLLGMALLKLGVLYAERSVYSYAAMMAIGYAIGIPVRAWASWYEWQRHWDVWSFFPVAVTYDLGRISIAAGHVALIMLICKLGWMQWLTRRLAAVGQMALTNYLTHSLVCTTLFYGYGFGWYGSLERYQLYFVVVSIWIFQLIVSPIWLRYFLFGPAEWLWRSLTYWKPQPMRIGPGE